MTQNNNNGLDKNNIFSFLYRTRIKITKGDVTILNLSLIFFILSLLCAPWLVVIGCIVAMVLGYRFGCERNAQGFSGSFDHVVHDAASNVKSAVETFTKEKGEDMNSWDGTEDHH